MSYRAETSAHPATVQPELLPDELRVFQLHLEAIRQQEWARSKGKLQELSVAQRRSIEGVMEAITKNIFEQVAVQWEIASAEEDRSQFNSLLCSMWGLSTTSGCLNRR